MATLLGRLPWFLSTALVAVAVVAFGIVGNILVGVYFERTSLNEADPLAGLAVVSAGEIGAGTNGAQPPSAPTAAQPSPATARPGLLLQGAFKDGAPGHHGSGTAKIGRDANGDLVLVVDNFSVTNGPDLRVILGANAAGGGSGLDLGKLKATDGTFSYKIPEGTELGQFKSVTIWCRSFPTIFAYATLEG